MFVLTVLRQDRTGNADHHEKQEEDATQNRLPKDFLTQGCASTSPNSS